MGRQVDPEVNHPLQPLEGGHTRQKDMAIPPVEIHPHLITLGAILTGKGYQLKRRGIRMICG